MDGIRASIPVLRFCAGPLHLGIAAEDVLEILTRARVGDPHIASILGVEPADVERRTIRLPAPTHHAQSSVAFQADTPMDVVQCDADALLPLPGNAATDRWRPVIGFARFPPHLVLLLDIAGVAAALVDRHHHRSQEYRHQKGSS